MNRIYTYIWTLIALTAFGSCSSDYLNTYPTNSVSPNTVFSSVENVKGAVNGMAMLMGKQYATDYGQGFNGEGTIKLYHGQYPGNNFAKPYHTGWNPLYNMQYNERNTSVYDHFAWTYYYRIISNANVLLENIDNVPDATDKQKAFYSAQALTFRAYAYSQLIQIYAPRWKDNNGDADGVILRLSSDFEDKGLSTIKEVYAQIYEDLDVAISNFTISEMSPEDLFLPGKNAAHAVYARAAINRQDYQTALTQAQLAKSGFPLMSNTDYKAGFCNPSSEWIWYVFGSSNETLYYFSYGAYIAYNGNSSSTRLYRSCIASDLLNKIPNTDVRKSLFIHPGLWADSDPNTAGYQNTNGFTQDWNIKDAGLVNQTYNIVKSPASYGEGNYPFYNEIKNYISNVAAFNNIPAAAYTNIYEHLKFGQFGSIGESNINLFRSSEMVLIEAEANYFLGNTAEAQQALETLNSGSNRDATYSCTKTGTDLFDEIVTYRGIELWGEGYDWFDMKRWGLPIQRTSIANGGSFHTTQAITIAPTDANNWTWALPLAEIDTNDQLSTEKN